MFAVRFGSCGRGAWLPASNDSPAWGGRFLPRSLTEPNDPRASQRPVARLRLISRQEANRPGCWCEGPRRAAETPPAWAGYSCRCRPRPRDISGCGGLDSQHDTAERWVDAPEADPKSGQRNSPELRDGVEGIQSAASGLTCRHESTDAAPWWAMRPRELAKRVLYSSAGGGWLAEGK